MTSTAGSPHTDPAGGRFDEGTNVDDVSVGSLVSGVLGDVSDLMRKEIELAKAEIREEAAKVGKGVGMLGGAGLAGYFALLLLSFTLVWVLDEWLPLWAGGLIVTALWAIGAGALYFAGRAQLKQVHPVPEQTVQSLKEDVQWARAQKN